MNNQTPPTLESQLLHMSQKQKEHAVKYLWDKQLNKLRDIDRVDEFVATHGNYKRKVTFK